MTKHCEKCFDYLDTELELYTKLCDDCYVGPRHFTFFDWEIEEFEEEQELLKMLELACEKKRKAKKEAAEHKKRMDEQIKKQKKQVADYWHEEMCRESERRYRELKRHSWNKY